MHTLYASPFSCSFAVHLVLRQQGIPHELKWVDRGEGRLIRQADLGRINPFRKVPTLTLPDGEVTTEVSSILLSFDPRPRSPTQIRQHQAWLSVVATELHKPLLAPAFDAQCPEGVWQDALERLIPHTLGVIDAHLEDRETLLADPEPSPADAYLFWALTLLRYRWPERLSANLARFHSAYGARPWTGPTLAIEQAARIARSG